MVGGLGWRVTTILLKEKDFNQKFKKISKMLNGTRREETSLNQRITDWGLGAKPPATGRFFAIFCYLDHFCTFLEPFKIA